MKLFFRKYGVPGQPIVIVHGLYGSSDNWITIAKALSDSFQVFCIDQRNHGQSLWNEEMNYQVMANDLLEFIQQENLKNVILLGHSMGGKTVMEFALEHPNLVDKLVVIDIAPKSYGSYSNFAQLTNDHRSMINALLSINPSEFKSRTKIENKLEKEIPDSNIRAFLLKNISRDENKKLVWKINLPILSNNLQTLMEGVGEDKANLEFPEQKQVILIRGERSPYVMDEDMQSVRKFFPSAQMATIPNAGHWLHAEQPDLFLKTVRYFLE